MPVTLRNKRRSLHISHNVNIADLTKEALSRPRSWYLSGTNTEAADPYTSVRKLFYDFNKQTFYGDNNKENNNNNRDNKFIIANGHTKLTPPRERAGKEGNDGNTAQKNLRNSFRKLELKTDSNSTLTGSDAGKEKSNDNNNNNTLTSKSNPIPIIPPKAPTITPPKPPSTGNFIQRTVFSSKPSDTSSLKEESSSYADFYVPNSAASKSSGNFLRRSYKRRSYDSSKFSAFDYVQRISKDDDIMSVVSSVSKYSTKAPSLTSPLTSPLSVHDEEVVDPQPMIERYLRDANKDICAGVYPAADTSLTVQEDLDSEDEDRSRTRKKKKRQSFFIPWNKRWTFIEATYRPDDEATAFYRATLKNRNGSGRFSSFRRSIKSSKTSSVGDNSQKGGSKKLTLRRMNSLDRDTVRSNRSTASTLRRHHSEKYKKRKMSNTSSLSKQSIQNDVVTAAPLVKNNDLQRNVKTRKSSRYNKMGFDTRCFFDRYQDNLRVEMFSIKLPSTSTMSSSSYANTTPTSTDDSSSVFDYNEENLSKEFDYKLVGKTYQQLFYIRSRLSASAMKSEFMCDGVYGCGSNDIHCTPPQWV